MPLFEDLAALLHGSVGNNMENNPQDLTAAKQLFAAEGRYKRPVDENKYIDHELDEAITTYQRDKNLKIDGIMNPGGETEAMLINKRLKLPEPKIEKANAGALPLLPLFAILSGAIGLQNQRETEEWWKSTSTDNRENAVRGLERRRSGRISKEEEARCEEILRRLTDTCNRVKDRYGEKEASKCRAQAMEVYSACLAGKKTQPPFHY